MKSFLQELRHVLRRMLDYQIVQITMVLSVVFAVLMAVFPVIDPLNFVSLSLFIMPVILFSIATFLYRDDDPVKCEHPSKHPVRCSVVAQLVASVLIHTLPFIIYTTILVARGHHFNEQNQPPSRLQLLGLHTCLFVIPDSLHQWHHSLLHAIRHAYFPCLCVWFAH